MKILISGASGLVGKAITNSLSQKGHQIIPLSRKRNPKTPYWDIEKKIIELGNHHEIDVVINLAGESIAEGRWDKQKKERILNSRVKGTELLSGFFSSIANKPKIFISGSAIGFYGDRAEEELTETSTKGRGFLPDVCSQWEQATGKASQAGIRVAILRFGMILSPQGGALAIQTRTWRYCWNW